MSHCSEMPMLVDAEKTASTVLLNTVLLIIFL